MEKKGKSLWFVAGFMVLLFSSTWLLIGRYRHRIKPVDPAAVTQLIPLEAQTLAGQSKIDLSRIKDLAGGFYQGDPRVFEYKKQAMIIRNPSVSDWYTIDNEPIAINLPVRLLLNFASQNEDTSLTITGRGPKNRSPWWADILRLYLSYNKKTRQMTGELRDGTALANTANFDFKNDYGESDSIILVIDDQNTGVLEFYSAYGRLLYRINLKEIPDMNFKYGLLPDRIMSIGANLSPGSVLVINKLLIYE